MTTSLRSFGFVLIYIFFLGNSCCFVRGNSPRHAAAAAGFQHHAPFLGRGFIRDNNNKNNHRPHHCRQLNDQLGDNVISPGEEKEEQEPDPKEKALQELKERARYTAQMETTKTLADKFVKLTQTMAKRVSPRSTKKLGAAKRISKPSSWGGLWTKSRKSSARTMSRFWKRYGTKGFAKYSGRARSAAASATAAGSSRITASGKLAKKAAAAAAAAKKGTTTAAVLQKGAGRKATGKLLAHQGQTVAAVRKGTTTVARKSAGRRAIAVSGRRLALRRAGRVLTLAMPVVGGAFALLAFRADYSRSQEEWDRRRSSTTRNTTFHAAFLLFAFAALADYIDTLCHFIIAHTLFLHGRAQLLAVESTSMACAIVSTVCAVAGELYSRRDDLPESRNTAL